MWKTLLYSLAANADIAGPNPLTSRVTARPATIEVRTQT